jgi:hypothetical protein
MAAMGREREALRAARKRSTPTFRRVVALRKKHDA